MNAVTDPGVGANVILLAHAGHWLVNLMYLAPVVGFLGWLGIITVRERREQAAEERQQHKGRSNEG